MLVGMVATEEQVPKETAAGLSRCWNMTFAAPLPPPKRAYIGEDMSIYAKHIT